ncbi:unnamed protein product [Discosporangium mesarthrocarpum]
MQYPLLASINEMKLSISKLQSDGSGLTGDVGEVHVVENAGSTLASQRLMTLSIPVGSRQFMRASKVESKSTEVAVGLTSRHHSSDLPTGRGTDLYPPSRLSERFLLPTGGGMTEVSRTMLPDRLSLSAGHGRPGEEAFSSPPRPRRRSPSEAEPSVSAADLLPTLSIKAKVEIFTGSKRDRWRRGTGASSCWRSVNFRFDFGPLFCRNQN